MSFKTLPGPKPMPIPPRPLIVCNSQRGPTPYHHHHCILRHFETPPIIKLSSHALRLQLASWSTQNNCCTTTARHQQADSLAVPPHQTSGVHYHPFSSPDSSSSCTGVPQALAPAPLPEMDTPCTSSSESHALFNQVATPDCQHHGVPTPKLSAYNCNPVGHQHSNAFHIFTQANLIHHTPTQGRSLLSPAAAPCFFRHHALHCLISRHRQLPPAVPISSPHPLLQPQQQPSPTGTAIPTVGTAATVAGVTSDTRCRCCCCWCCCTELLLPVLCICQERVHPFCCWHCLLAGPVEGHQVREVLGPGDGGREGGGRGRQTAGTVHFECLLTHCCMGQMWWWGGGGGTR